MVKVLQHLIIFLCLFVCTNTLYSQDEITNTPVTKENRNNLIDNLEMKERTIGLSIEEYIQLYKQYTKKNLKYKSLIILDKLIIDLKKTNNYKDLSIVYNWKAENLVDLNKIDEGVAFCDKILKEMVVNNSSFQEEMCLKCGILYNEDEQFSKAYTIYKKIKNPIIKSSPVYIDFYGLILMNNGIYDEALKYLKKGIQLSYENEKLSSVNISFNNIANIYIAKQKWKIAKKYLDSSYRSVRYSDNPFDKKKILKSFYFFFILQNKFDEARRVIDNIEIENTFIYDYRINQKIKELDAINSRKKRLTKKVTVINNSIRDTNNQKLKIYVILISIITILMSWILLKIYKNTKLKYKKIINEQELLSSQMTPHFIFNSLSILQGMLLNKEKTKAVEYIDKFSNIIASTVKEKSQKFISIADEIKLLKDYVDIQNLSTHKNIDFSVVIGDDIDHDFFIPSMILQPFIENAIIHGFKKEIEYPTLQLSLQQINNELLCIITDNGVGFSIGDKPRKNQEKTSLATQIVKERLAILSKKMNHNFSLEIRNLNYKQKRGTEVLLNLPYTQNP